MEDVRQQFDPASAAQMNAMIGNCKAASEFLKALAHEGR